MMNKTYDVVVIGGGLSGICAAIAAARQGASTALIHARPVLGGNASSEIRMHICGADRHGERANARETGILEEILLENKYRNHFYSYPVFDSVIWSKVAFEENLDLYLNTCADRVEIAGGKIVAVSAYQQTTEKQFRFSGAVFIDATGDGTIGALAGADFVIGREAKSEYDEADAPEQADHYTMGNSIMFKTKKCDHPVPFIKPDWAYSYTEHDLRNRDHGDIDSGYWWLELGGGKFDTISDSEEIYEELMKCVYGIWDHIKNGGDHGAECYDLEWVGMVPGKRESRRFLGDYVLREDDCVEGRHFDDAVAYGGWALDMHAVEGFLNDNAEPTRYIEVKDLYTIPYRCLYARNVDNLMLAGRIISASHLAFASSRVMGTCAVAGQAAGVAAALAASKGLTPREVGKSHIGELQQLLLKDDCYIPGIKNTDENDKARTALVSASYSNPRTAPEYVINGTARTVHEDTNCWSAAISENPSITLDFDKEITANQLVITFDSNLSNEIQISLDNYVTSRQIKGVPPEIVKDFKITLSGETGEEIIAVENNYLRHYKLRLETEKQFKTIKISDFTTHGGENAKIFEIRVY